MPTFYSRFFLTSQEVKEKFKRTDFGKQNGMLISSLKLVAAATEGEPAGLRELRARATTHDRFHLDIQPELYELWLKSVLDTAREYDGQWDATIEEAWTKTLRHAIDFMVKRY